MGKNNRHKKQLKSERSKVKLKGRTLPKGTNVTNTVFKVRKIIIGEQLKHVGENKVDVATQIKVSFDIKMYFFLLNYFPS